MQDQVRQYLLDNTEMDLPDGAVTRHTARVLQRRGLELMRLGYTAEQIEERITKIQVLAGQEARRDLKLSFILQRIAEDSEVEVTDEEINARVAMLASAQNRRPERLRHEMESDGSLEQLAVAIQEEKVLDTLLADAEIIDATAEDEAEAEPESEAESTQTEGAAPETEAPKAQEAEGQGEAPADQDI